MELILPQKRIEICRRKGGRCGVRTCVQKVDRGYETSCFWSQPTDCFGTRVSLNITPIVPATKKVALVATGHGTVETTQLRHSG